MKDFGLCFLSAVKGRGLGTDYRQLHVSTIASTEVITPAITMASEDTEP
jgi:hypothetical protein